MANPSDVLFQLQTRLDTLDKLSNVKINNEKDLEEDIGSNPSGATGSGFGSSLANRYASDGTDVEDSEEVDEPYITNRGIAPADNAEPRDRKSKIKVERIFDEIKQVFAEGDTDIPDEGSIEPPMASDEKMADNAEDVADQSGTEPPAGDEMAGMEGGEGMEGMEGMEGGAGMGEMEDQIKTPSEIGRIYELKKIYTRLTTIESYLSDSSDPDLLRIRLLVSKSIELFEILSSNIPAYQPPKSPRETIDEIIVMYYKFLKKIYESVAVHYKKQSKKLSSSGLTKTKITIDDKELV